MGLVYKARDTRLDRSVAIKVLSDQISHDPQFKDRFQREARVVSQLDHPNICSLPTTVVLNWNTALPRR